MKGRYGIGIIVGMVLLVMQGCGDDDREFLPGKFSRLLENQVWSSSLLNVSVQYAVLLPEGYDESTDRYPVVYLLHGYGDTQKAWYTSGALQYYVDANLAETGPMIYVMPQAFNTYYIDQYAGSFPYMKMLVEELVPEIDKRFRTVSDKSKRAVMGYSMGGYGALILPAMNPDVFSVSVPLSMSFRTDEQYVQESQGSFDNQWAPNFGPSRGVSGTARLTPYFKDRSPFHFFNTGDATVYNSVKYLIDCGDDEESLIFTNNNMHSVMREQGIQHEYRVRSGGHSFDYWKKSYPEALKFISNAFKGIAHPAEPTPAPIGALITESELTTTGIGGTTVRILLPLNYAASSEPYPVLYVVHDGGTQPAENRVNTFSLLRNAMTASKIVQSIVVEIPTGAAVDDDLIKAVVAYTDETYRTKNVRANRVMMGNGNGAGVALQAANDTDLFSDCFILNAQLAAAPQAVSQTVFYYLDGVDKSASFKGYENLFANIRNEGTDGYEYRIRQGGESYQAFLNGLNDSFSYLRESLNR